MDIEPRKPIDPSAFWMGWFIGLGAVLGMLVGFMVGLWDPRPAVEVFASSEHRVVRRVLGIRREHL